MPKTRFTRLQIWQHNGHFGRVAMMRRGLMDIIDSDTTTDLSKHLARSMLDQCTYLYSSLKIRKEDPCKPSLDENI